ncbi:hypothetical protein Hypma_014228 [Hypsizygus marmoreus]|uniref:Uncharacterized protein n=1 Tax=Hypsizygus marmoreus TaxID=39966 RepID=A0A369JBA1_HYPMA|nr:hypothetical protein Hypma_014228 [Hypsizygus marmoreus]
MQRRLPFSPLLNATREQSSTKTPPSRHLVTCKLARTRAQTRQSPSATSESSDDEGESSPLSSPPTSPSQNRRTPPSSPSSLPELISLPLTSPVVPVPVPTARTAPVVPITLSFTANTVPFGPPPKPRRYSSDSDSPIPPTPTRPIMSPNTKDAIASQLSQNQPPTFSDGLVTPAILDDFDWYCQRYFRAKDIAAADQVGKILYCLESPRMRSWVKENEAVLSALTFPQFIARMHVKWLKPGWEADILTKLHSFQGDKGFEAWVGEVRRANTTIADSTNHIANNKLIAHLLIRINNDLRDEYTTSDHDHCLTNLTDVDEWITAVTKIDEGLQRIQAKADKVFLCAAINIGSSLGTAAAKAPKTTLNKNVVNTSASSSITSTAPGKWVGKLSEHERELLMNHQGCLKCRKLYSGHQAKDCTAPPLLRAEYIPLTDDIANTAKTAWEKKRKATGNRTTAIPVAAIFENAVATITDGSSDGDEHEDHHASEYVLPKHLWWTCHVVAPACLPTPVNALIDSGAPPAMISSTFADSLALPRSKLKCPLHVAAAFSTQKDIVGQLELNEFVKITLQSPDAQWQSRTQIFIICPNLFTPIIVGLDFLGRNHLVIDAEARTVFDKKLGVDLFNLPDPKLNRIPAKSSPHT